MVTRIGLFGVGNVDYTTKGYTQVNGGIEASLNFYRGIHSNTSFGLNSQPYIKQKLGYEFNLYDGARNSWNVGLDLYGKAEANVNLVKDKTPEISDSFDDYCQHYKTFGTFESVNRYAAQGGIGTELIVRTPIRQWGNLKGTYAEIGVGVEGGIRYDGIVNSTKRPLEHDEHKFNKVSGYCNPFAEAVVHLGRSPWLVGAEVSAQSAAVKVGCVLNAE